MAFWPNKGEVDARPALGAPYQRIAPGDAETAGGPRDRPGGPEALPA